MYFDNDLFGWSGLFNTAQRYSKRNILGLTDKKYKKKRKRELSLDFGDDDASTEFLFEADEVSPTSAMEQDELAKIIQNAIEKLDEKHKLVFVLAHYQDLKYAEIADILDIPLGTVKTRMMHAERKLREILRPHFPADENEVF